jgi:hypothetical protein
LIFDKKNVVVKPSIRPDNRYPALTGYPAGYPVYGFWISWISGQPDIRQKQYPVQPSFDNQNVQILREKNKVLFSSVHDHKPIKYFNIRTGSLTLCGFRSG